jgi:hypothetical protein
MPIRVKTDIDFGDIFYLKSDPDQTEHILVGLIIVPGNQIKFRLSCFGDICEVYDFEASKEIDELKKLSSDKGGEE